MCEMGHLSAPVMMKLERLRRERFHTNMVCVDYCNYSLSTSGPPYNSQGGGGGGRVLVVAKLTLLTPSGGALEKINCIAGLCGTVLS